MLNLSKQLLQPDAAHLIHLLCHPHHGQLAIDVVIAFTVSSVVHRDVCNGLNICCNACMRVLLALHSVGFLPVLQVKRDVTCPTYLENQSQNTHADD